MSTGSVRRNTTTLPAACSSSTAEKRSASLLGEMAGILGSHFDVSLPVSQLPAPDSGKFCKEGKKFSVGLLEKPGTHSWSKDPRFSRLDARARLSIAGSLFLWRKTLPVEPPSIAAHKARISAPEIQLPPGYILHICKLVDEMFPVGWDSGYMAAVDGATPSIKSVVGQSRKKGGYRSLCPDREQYALRCIGELPVDLDRKVCHMQAPCDGKIRDVTVMTSSAQVLKPVHKLIYDRLSTLPWLLRGKAKASSFRRFKRVAGEVFVSGDYESATDHLPVTSAEWILRCIFRNCTSVPESVQIACLSFLRVQVEYKDGDVVEATRQLMGSLLCFPLLCLQNYIAFRWVFPASVPVKINGDDIVFRSSRADYQRWADFVISVGLHLSPGKTLVHSSTFSLNSTFFSANENHVDRKSVV